MCCLIYSTFCSNKLSRSLLKSYSLFKTMTGSAGRISHSVCFINTNSNFTIRLDTSRPLGKRSEPFLAAKRPTASDEVVRGLVRAIWNPTKDFYESLLHDMLSRSCLWVKANIKQKNSTNAGLWQTDSNKQKLCDLSISNWSSSFVRSWILEQFVNRSNRQTFRKNKYHRIFPNRS